MSLTARRRKRPEINIVPLIDVLTMLIFFFLVSMQFREVATLNLTLPKVETAGKNEFSGAVVIGVDEEGRIFFNGKEASEEELEGLMRSVREVDRDMTVLIKADENTPLKTVTFVMDTSRKHGLNKISLQSR